jgi:integrase
VAYLTELVHTISELTIREFINTRLNIGRRPATINRETSIIKQTLELAVLQGYIPVVPRIQRLSEAGNTRQGFFTDEEMRRLLPHLPDDLRDFTLFAYLMGWRKSEIASLAWSDFDGTCIRLGDSKTGEQRVLPLNTELSALIGRRWQVRCGTFIFHREGQPIRHIRRAWHTACGKAGLDGRLFHDTRRSAVRRLIQYIPEREVMMITGHKTRHMLERYHILSERDLMDVWRKYGGADLISPEPSPQPLENIERKRIGAGVPPGLQIQ